MDAQKKHAAFRYLRYLRPYRWLLAAVIVAGIAKFSLPLIPNKIAQIIINQVVQNDAGLAQEDRLGLLWKLAAGMVGVALLELVAIYIRGVGTVTISASMAFDLRQDLWKHLQRLSLNFHNSRPTGSLISRLMTDIGQAQQMISGGIINVAIDVGAGGIALAALLYTSWQLTLLVLMVLPIYGWMYARLNPRIRQVSHDVQEQQSVISGSAVERLAGIAVVQSFAQEPAETRQFTAQVDELRDLSVQRGKLNNILASASEFMIAISTATVFVAGGYFAVGDTMDAGAIVFFLLTMAQLYRPIRRFSEINIVYQQSMAAIERVFTLFDEVPEVQERPGVADRTPGMGGLSFENVQFSYNASTQVLKGLNFDVAPGERVAIVGESGAGKSTLVTLIPRLYDIQAGSIRIDGIDVRDYPLRRLRRSIGIVLQDPILFSGTIRENLRYGRKRASDADILDAARAANAHQFITALPEGYETIIGERGMSLSGGQRQRLSLARTLLQNPRILILDEATSSLDSESENLITEALQRVMAGRTSLIIAHRLSTVIGADRILVLRDGRLVESGPHSELLAQGGYYRYLFEQQFGPLEQLMKQARDIL